MKRALLTVALALLGAFAFSQEPPQIAVFPFEDMDNVLTKNESIFFYRQFSNEFTNKNSGRFTIVPRQDVDKLIDTEAKFQLSDFSAKTKTAEMRRVLNGTRILSGLIGRVGNSITISISLYTYPELSQLPGGVDLRVANVLELFDKIPELVQEMQTQITSEAEEKKQKAEEEKRIAEKKKQDAENQKNIRIKARKDALSRYFESANRDSIEYGTNHYVEWNENYKGFYWEPISIHWSLIPLTSVGLGAGFGFGNTNDGQAITKGGVTPYAGLVIPINKNVRLFGDGFMEVGYNNIGSFFNGSGLALNPGFDTGILFSFESFGFNLRYKGLWAGDGGYINSLGITMSENATKKKFDTDAGLRIWLLSGLGLLFTGIVGASYQVNSGVPNTAAGAAGIIGFSGAFVCLIGGIATAIIY
jgi:TolB-like protein